MNTKSLDLILEKVQLFDPNLGLLFDQAAAELAELKEENEKNRLGTEIHYWVKITRLRAELDKANKVITDGVQAINTDFVNNNRVGLSTWFLAAESYLASLPQEDKHD
jgi:hypothetical protein